MNVETRFKVIWIMSWSLSTFALICGLVFIQDPKISSTSHVYASLLVQAGGAFFFALTVGWVIDRLRHAQGYSILWLFSQEFRKAGVLAFYSDRKNDAEKALEEAFENHSNGEVLMVGASLRLFLGPGLHFYSWIQELLRKRGRSPVTVRALSCHPEDNHELPVRSFVEDFNQDRTFPKYSSFDYRKRIDFDFHEFEKEFFTKHGIAAFSKERCRIIHDLEATQTGVNALRGVAKEPGNSILHREYNFAPYCTVIIFPDRAFYTPNLLSTEVPVNMPLIVFHKSSDAYKKLVNYFEFIWWASDPRKEN
jgi:hypothetical protein